MKKIENDGRELTRKKSNNLWKDKKETGSDQTNQISKDGDFENELRVTSGRK
jgi:hypothetical protein